MKKKIITLTVVLATCATFVDAHVRISLRGGVKNLHRQGVVGLAKGNTGSVVSRYHGVKPVGFRRSNHVRISVRGGAKNHHQQGVQRLARGKNEPTLSQYHGINRAAVERRVVQEAEQKSSSWRAKSYEVKVPNQNGGFDVYERAADGTITLKKP